MLRGYDIDGVLVPFRIGEKPVAPFVIISGRQNIPEHRENTRKLLRDAGIEFTDSQLNMRYFGGDHNDYQSSAEYKAEMINKLGVERFFEDEEKQAAILKRLCPNCEIRLV